jgi:hypothetical protein
MLSFSQKVFKIVIHATKLLPKVRPRKLIVVQKKYHNVQQRLYIVLSAQRTFVNVIEAREHKGSNESLIVFFSLDECSIV